MTPASLKILGHTVAVEKMERGGRGNIGECEHDANRIAIGDWLEESVADATLLHEVMHFVSDCLGLDAKEEVVAGLAQGLFQVFQDNPEFLRGKK
jgi:hypothetical protein